MLDYKIFLGVLTIVVGTISYYFYFRDVFSRKTKPEAFSWFIWGILASIIFFAQNEKGGGPGTWATAFTAVVCFIIVGITFSRGGTRLRIIDTISLIGVAGGVGLWYYTKDPLTAVISSIVVGALGFVPTFRKAFDNPYEETEITYFLNASKFAIALLALESYNLVTWLYPAAITLMNVSLAVMIFLRRRYSTRYKSIVG